jgi:hypothetical protein
MIPSSLNKIASATLLIALLSIPLNATAATALNFSFDATIYESIGSSSPLNVGENVTGNIAFQASDWFMSDTDTIDVLGASISVTVDIFTGSSSGSASGPGWSQAAPGFAIGLVVIDDFLLTTGSMANLPGFVTPSMYPNLPSDGDTIDLILISVASNDFPYASQEKTFDVGFVYDAADGVVTGAGLAGIDATQLLSSAVYGEFLAESLVADTENVIWEASGLIGAAVVPVPAAVWLFGSALLGLMGFARKRIA